LNVLTVYTSSTVKRLFAIIKEIPIVEDHNSSVPNASMTMANQTAPTTRNIQMPGLLRLPLELRHQIYYYMTPTKKSKPQAPWGLVRPYCQKTVNPA
jgi:hypothetical protein